MNKPDLIKQIADQSTLSGMQVDSVLDALAKVASKALGEGDDITLPGIGKLSVSERAARTGRNPRTGEPVDIPAKSAVKFKAAKALAVHVA